MSGPKGQVCLERKNPPKANTISGSPVPLHVFSLYLVILHSVLSETTRLFFSPSPASVVSISEAALIAGSLLKICILVLSSPLPGLLFLEASMHGFPLPLWGHLLKAKSTCVGLGCLKNQNNPKQQQQTIQTWLFQSAFFNHICNRLFARHLHGSVSCFPPVASILLLQLTGR